MSTFLPFVPFMEILGFLKHIPQGFSSLYPLPIFKSTFKFLRYLLQHFSVPKSVLVRVLQKNKTNSRAQQKLQWWRQFLFRTISIREKKPQYKTELHSKFNSDNKDVKQHGINKWRLTNRRDIKSEKLLPEHIKV